MPRQLVPPDDVILKAHSCYCFIWDQDHEEAKEWQRNNLEIGITRGYCGECGCGKPGHVCPYPGPVPYTGCWCDDCYIKECKVAVARFSPKGNEERDYQR